MPNYRRRLSETQRRATIAIQDYYRALQARRERLINYLFYNKPLVLVSIWLRIVFMLFFCWIGFGHGQPGSSRTEIVKNSRFYIAQTRNVSFANRIARGKVVTHVLSFRTNFGSYEARRDYRELPNLHAGDTVVMQYSLFGKPAACTVLRSNESFDIWIGWVPIVFVGFITLASFAAYQGYDYTTNIVIVVACIADGLMFVYYFVYC